MGSEPFPSVEQGLSLHQRLLDDDPTAPLDLIHSTLSPLLRWLGRHFPTTTPDLVHQAVADALLALCRQPHTFDPQRDPDLFRYLCRSARGDLANALRSERNRRQKEILVAVVEDARSPGNDQWEDDPVQQLMAREDAEEKARLFGELESLLVEPDRSVLRLLRAGETRTAAFAEVLGLSAHSVEEQRRGVKQAKDRVKKRLQREGKRYARSN